jgi:transposase
MIQVDDKEIIRRAYLIDNKSQRQIAKELHHSRHTVAAALADPASGTYELRMPRPAPVLAPYQSTIEQWLRDDLEAPRKQRRTAHRIYTQLVELHHFPGAESSVRRYVRRCRTELEPPEAFLLLTYAPGLDAQCDFGEAQVLLAGEPVTAQFFCIRLCYSKLPFVWAFPHQRQEAFLEGQRRGFEFFEGTPHRVWYDNLKTAVLKILQGHRREEQQAFIAFRSHYLLESRFCTPGEGHEKGLVENLVGYARRNFFTPVPQSDSWEALNAELLARCRAEAARRLRGETQTIGELWAEEKGVLLPLPPHPYECCRWLPVRVNRYSLITFETNRYSVPVDYVGRQVLVKAFVHYLEVVWEDRVIATHRRCYERERDVLDPQHFLRLILQRPGAWEHAKAMREWQARWPKVYDRYLAVLREHHPEPQGLREFVRILALHRTYTEAQIATALEWALAAHCFSWEGVWQWLREHAAPSPGLDAEGAPAASAHPSPQVALPNLAQYQALVETGGPDGN